MKEFYEHFKNSRAKTVIVISDKQAVLRVSNNHNEKEIGGDHMSMTSIATKDMNLPTMSHGFLECSNDCVYFFGQDDNYDVQFPFSGKISKSQQLIIDQILDDFKKANTDRDSNQSKKIYFDTPSGILEDVDQIKETLKKLPTPDVHTSKENIIGITPDKDDIKESIIYNLDFESTETMINLASRVKLAQKYYDDPYYHDILLEVFPNFEKMNEFSNYIVANKFSDLKIEGMHLEDVEETFKKKIGDLCFNNKNSLSDNMKKMNDSINLLFENSDDPQTQEEIKKYYPNYELLNSIINNTNLSSQIDLNKLQDKSGFDEISRELITSAYTIKSQTVQELQDKIAILRAKYSKIQRRETADTVFEEQYAKKEKANSEETLYEQKLQEIESSLSEISEDTSKHELIVNPPNNGLFNKIRNIFNKTFNRQKIKDSEDKITANDAKKQELEEKYTKYKQQLETSKRKSLNVEMEFKKQTKLNISLDDYKKKLDEEKQRPNFEERKQTIQAEISELSEQLISNQQFLSEIKESGFINPEPKNIAEDISPHHNPKIEDSFER